MDIVERLRHTEEETATIGQELVYLQIPVNPDGPEAADEIERLRRLLKNPTEEMLKAGRAANRLVAGNALGLACIAPDAAWSAMANLVLSEITMTEDR
jgi:hypothetical protein